MCNLYRLRSGPGEIAELFSVINAAENSNIGSHVYPGYPGLVVAEGKVRSMTWGFPLAMKSKRTGKPLKPKPVNNARTDKLDSFFWRSSFGQRRCLIPLTAWAEAEGPKGAKTRTWLSYSEYDVFALAGIWRHSDEWGECYSMIMTDAVGEVAAVHDRMPVLLTADSYRVWQDGDVDEAKALCQPTNWQVSMTRTQEPWVG